MRERDWLISVIGELVDREIPAPHLGSKVGSDLNVIVELTNRRIEGAFDQSKRLKGRVKPAGREEQQVL